MQKFIRFTALFIAILMLVSCTPGLYRESGTTVAETVPEPEQTSAATKSEVETETESESMAEDPAGPEREPIEYLNMTEEEAKEATLKFIIATGALQMRINNWEYSDFGRGDTDDYSDLSDNLRDHWYVSDKSTAALNVEWLVREGLKAEFLDVCRSLRSQGISGSQNALEKYLSNCYDDEDIGWATAKVYLAYLENGANAINAYDYNRAIACLQWYVYANYYTRDEALEAAFQIAQQIQQEFRSWDEYIDSYMLGAEYYLYESADDRREMYEEILESDFNPYSVPWNVPLTRFWDEAEIPVSSNVVTETYGSWVIPDGWCKNRYYSNDWCSYYCKKEDALKSDFDSFSVDYSENYYSDGEEDQFEEYMHTLYSSGYFYDNIELIDEQKSYTDFGDPMFTYVIYDSEDETEITEIYILGDEEQVCFTAIDSSGTKSVYDTLYEAVGSFHWTAENT